MSRIDAHSVATIGRHAVDLDVLPETAAVNDLLTVAADIDPRRRMRPLNRLRPDGTKSRARRHGTFQPPGATPERTGSTDLRRRSSARRATEWRHDVESVRHLDRPHPPHPGHRREQWIADALRRTIRAARAGRRDPSVRSLGDRLLHRERPDLIRSGRSSRRPTFSSSPVSAHPRERATRIERSIAALCPGAAASGSAPNAGLGCAGFHPV